MNNEQTKQLCLNLMKADTEKDVIRILSDAGLWYNSTAWRNYGDYENNYNTIGNQQSSPDAALIEKIVNAIDARLTNECLARGIDPEGSAAPRTIHEAVARFFDEGIDPKSVRAGRMQSWSTAKRTEVAQGITVVATGAKARAGKPCFTIADAGEGQTPADMPDTLLSLNKSNKLRIPFVQGKFNMGSTGVLNFCGRNNLQLVVTRRNPKILSNPLREPSDTMWGFTIVRRENPTGGLRSSVYTYLAPLGADLLPNKGGVLRFSADTMPIFPEATQPYARPSAYGTLVKLYEYSAGTFKSNMLMRDGLLSRADILLPEIALPVRFHECRDYGDTPGSLATTLTGLSVRLEDNKGANLEFSSSSSMSAAGEKMTATIYAFKKGKADTYRKNEGIIFTLNGQTHGYLGREFFARKAVGLSYIADSVLVLVDCSHFNARAREDLFMNSRDRLSRGELRAEIENTLEDLLKNHEGLRSLKEERRRKELEARLEDSKPLKETLEQLLKRSPTLSALFLQGERIANPFQPKTGGVEKGPFEGKPYPTHFQFRGKPYGTVLKRGCSINMRSRIIFETDANNDYFSRDIDPGTFSVFRVADDELYLVENYIMHLQDGFSTLSIPLPDNCQESDTLDYITKVDDSTQTQPFENKFTLVVALAAEPSGKQSPPAKRSKNGTGGEGQVPSGIALPNIMEIEEADWDKYSPPFDRHTALRVVNAGENDDGDDHVVYDFFVNVDNVYLKNEMKPKGEEPEILRKRFVYGLVFLGLAVLHEDATAKKGKNGTFEDIGTEENGEGNNVEKRVEDFSKAIAPFLLPVIESLGSLELESEGVLDTSGDVL